MSSAKVIEISSFNGADERCVQLNPTLGFGATSKLADYPSEKNLKKLTWVAVSIVFCLIGATAFAQQLDVGFGVSTTSSASGKLSNALFFPSDRGGTYPGFSADFLLHNRFGVEGELFWRASQNLYGGYEPYRPVFYSFNAIWAPRLTKNLTAEVLGGIGGEDIRFYGIPNYNPLSGFTNYTSSNHFMGDFGGGIRAYIWHSAFLRPEVRVYLINNNVEFSSNHVVRYGVTLGYSFGR